ncbi:MAG TPA: TonB-dependent receptor [Woeseiaceae bacterium]|nr:TonB-dependent receptor [Woeseiaceae bacterium]
MRKPACLTGLAGLVLAVFAHAAEQPAQPPLEPPETITVYGTRLDQRLTEVGSSVSVITAEDIESLGVNLAVDALARVPGVTVNQNGAFGGVASVRVRGAASEQTLVLVDGVVTNDPSSPGGGFNFATLDAANIERIEVLKGPQSTLWGSDAIGGVVNIVTKRPVPGFGGNVFLEAGSFGMLRGGGELSVGTEGYDLRLSAVDHSTDGISRADAANGNDEADAYDATTLNLNGGMAVGDDARLGVNFLWVDAEAEYDSFVFGAEGNVGDGDEFVESGELTADLTFDFSLLDGRFENRLLAGYAEIERDNYTNGAFSFGSEGERNQYRYQGTVRIDEANELAFGAERETIVTPDGETSLDGLFALYEWQAHDELTLTAGLRRDEHEEFAGETTGRFALAYNPHELLTLRASWGEGFKAPTLFQATFFCCGATGPNPDLEPETADGWDVGAEFRTGDGRGQLGITWFDQDTSNLIAFGNGSYENVARASSSGLELTASYALTEWVGVEIDYAYIDAEDGSGERLVRVPEHSGDLMLVLDPGGPFSGSVLLRYNGEERDPGGEVDAWTRVDLAGRYRLNAAIELFARVENLFDEEYQQVLGYGTPGLSGHLGARLRF